MADLDAARRLAGAITESDGVRLVRLVETGLGAVAEAGGRGGLAAAVGLAAVGERATAFLDDDELAASLDLLATATRRRLPLVIHATTERSHEACHAVARSTALFFAADVQDTVDLTLLGRRLAEDALTPVIVAMDGRETARAVHDLALPPPEAVRRFVGDPGDVLHPSTPSQEMLFGKHRRRLPRWHDLERPLLHGAEPEGADAARHAFFDIHLPELLARAVGDFTREFDRRPEALRTSHVDGARYLVLAAGAAVETAEAAVTALRGAGVKAGVVGLRVLRPLPAAGLVELMRGRRGVVVLERGDAGTLADQVRALLERARGDDSLPVLGDREIPATASAFHGASLRAADLMALVREMAAGRAPSPVYLGIDTASTDAAYPKRQALRDALRRAYPESARLGLRGGDGGAPVPQAAAPPPVVRRLGRGTAPIADLPGFWDRVRGVHAPAPDPFLATGAMPPISSALRDLSPARTVLPAFDPALCTGCGACWSACPDSAVAPVTMGPDRLLTAAMERAKARGRSVDKLRMVASKLAARVRREMAAPGWNGGPAGELLDAAFDAIKLPKGHEDDLREAYAAVREEIAALPVARTSLFFEEADDGDLFSLALDPDACKGCGLCVAACEAGALTATDDDAGRTAPARELWRLCDELPEPTDTARDRARRHPDAGPLAAALMSRAAREAMAGGHGAEPGSGPALALRQVLGVATEDLRPVHARQLKEITELKSSLAEAIHAHLARALPDRDLEALARGLDSLRRPDAELTELTARVETAFEDERVDVARTRRLVDAARALADLEWRWTTGEGGLGRAPFSLVLATPGLDWAASFPFQPFRVPVTVVAAGDAPAVARGIAEGQRREAVETARVMRRARLELDRSMDLDGDEHRLGPPLFLAVAEEDLRGMALAGLWELLASDLAVKILVLRAWAAEDDPSSSSLTGLFEAAKKPGFFTQSSVAHFDHLAAAVAGALDHDGPALLRVLAPSPARLAADTTLARARQTVASGAFALVPGGGAEDDRPTVDAKTVGSAHPTAEARHAAEIAALRQEHEALRQEYEARLAAARAEIQAETARRVRARLLRLALRRPEATDRPEVRP